MRRHPRRVTLALVTGLAVLALAACGDDGGVSADDSSASDTEQTDTASTEAPDTGEPETTAATTPETDAPTTEATTSTTEAPTTAAPATTLGGGEDGDTACGTLDPLIGSAFVTSTLPADWDGDGTQEATVQVYDTAEGAGDYRIRVEQPGGTGTEMAVLADSGFEPRVIAGVQVDFSLGSEQPQPQELLVTVGSNSSGFNLGVYFKDDAGCLGRFKGADESDLVLPIHASTGAASGLACDGGAGSQFLVRTEATPSAGSGEYDVHDIKLRRNGDQLLDDVDIPGFIIDDGSPTSPFARYASITNCGEIFGDE